MWPERTSRVKSIELRRATTTLIIVRHGGPLQIRFPSMVGKQVMNPRILETQPNDRMHMRVGNRVRTGLASTLAHRA